MNRAVDRYPGAIWNFSQPIEDNVGETLTGTKGAMALKIFGDDLELLEHKGEEVTEVMERIRACMTSNSCAISVSRISI